MTEFTSLTHLVRTGTPGDRYTEDHTEDHAADPKRRSITTHVFIERTSADAAVLDTIATVHRGKAEYVSRNPERCYETTYRPIPTEVEGQFVTQTWGMYDGQTRLAHRETNIARYSAKGLRAAHDIGVTQYNAWHTA